jgi:hypothetical protein
MEKILEQIDGIIGEAFYLPKSDATDRLLADLEDLRNMVASQHHAHADGACPHADTINPLGRVFCPDCRNLVPAPQVA